MHDNKRKILILLIEEKAFDIRDKKKCKKYFT